MLDIYYADREPGAPEDCCPLSADARVNFVSVLRTARMAADEHDGPLSIKCVFAGREVYEASGGRFAVDEGSYLILNRGQRYASWIESDSPIESFCVWFRPGFAEEALTALRRGACRMLNEPGDAADSAGQSVAFFERRYAHDDLVSPVLHRVRAAIGRGQCDAAWLEDQFHALADRMLAAHYRSCDDALRLPAFRHSTRIELYQRLYRARDFLDSSLDAPVSLTDAAAVACLSPHYFLRTFKQAFSETPHQYHVRRRLERARHLLRATRQPVTRICMDLGFESLGSFSWLFRRRFGASPTAFRQECGVAEPPAGRADAAPEGPRSAGAGGGCESEREREPRAPLQPFTQPE